MLSDYLEIGHPKQKWSCEFAICSGAWTFESLSGASHGGTAGVFSRR